MSGNIASVLHAKRGARFAGDKKTIALYIQRSKNLNVVVYDGTTVPSPEHGGRKLDPAAPIDAYWLDIDPAYQAKNRAKGKADDREELNFIDRWQAYGCKPKNIEALTAEVEFVALPKKDIRLTLEKDSATGEMVPVTRTTFNGVANCVLERIWVESDESGWIPSVKYIDMFGLHPDTQAAVTERFTP